MQTTISIHQPNFFPWTGFFNKIANSECFIYFDDVQFERGKTFTSRTKILCEGNEKWLTVPVIGKGDLLPINKVQCDNTKEWKKKHLSIILNYYKKAAFFSSIFPIIENIYHKDTSSICEFNILATNTILNYLEINTCCLKSSELLPNSTSHGLDKIIELLEITQAANYLSGSGMGSKRYINTEIFKEHSINLIWQTYKAIPYHQLKTTTFIPNLSILDLLFCKGKDSINLL